MTDQRLAFAIHELNTWGGQDRSTLEIAKHLSHKIPLTVVAYDAQNISEPEWGTFQISKISPNVPRPALFRFLYYYFRSYFSLKKFKCVHATGASSLVSDIVQVQFIHSTWRKKQKEFNLEDVVPGSFIKKIYHRFLTRFNIFFEKKIFTPEKKYIAISNSIKSELEEFFNIPPENIQVIHHGVAIKQFQPPSFSEEAIKRREEIRKQLGIQSDELAFIFVGAFNHRKGLTPLIKAYKKIASDLRTQAHLILVGGGEISPFKKLLDSEEDHKKIHFITHQKNIMPYYQASDVFILPSLYEPFGLVTLEAMACGLPSIVSESAGSAELINHNSDGFCLKNPSDTSEICNYMSQMISQKDQLPTFSKFARAKAENFDWSHVAEKYYEVIKKSLDS